MNENKYYIIFTIFQLVQIAVSSVLDPMIGSRLSAAFQIAFETTSNFYEMFEQCVNTPMPNQQFITDNLHNFVNYPMKTTVGFNPKYSSNRKFFANMISTPAFKEILTKDVYEMRIGYLKKMKYCDEAIMDQQILKDFYDREVDQSKV
ncbi:unnamed protein product [Parnassius mnemosyne]|uniref:Uncharacterized protein n=1 Tax=Parnassius mnemosyne TaxID=213953 RepID=A0AAV1LU98_9NEOP